MVEQSDIEDIEWKAYRNSSWGKTVEDDPELREISKKYLESNDFEEDGKINEAIEDGKLAFKLTNELQSIFNKTGQSNAESWLDSEEITSLNPRIKKSLRIKMEKILSFKRNRRNANGQQPSQVKAELIFGEHPNSLRLQDPSASWDIFVDETGSIFDENAKVLGASNRRTGRVVALAVPSHTQLPSLGAFHATESSFKEIDIVIQRLLDSKVGIFGFNVQDLTSRHSDWLGHILHLIRWTLLQLPVSKDAHKTSVNFFIEHRGSYSRDLSNNSWEIESEFRALDPERYSKLQLSLSFMGKNNPMNGYVDAIANTWGGTAYANRDRLKKSLLRGHCLIDTESASLHHLYLALRDRLTLRARDWYDLCSVANNDPENGFLKRSLDQLGQDLQRSPNQWHVYIDEVQARLHSKQYRLDKLNHAITWLERFASKDQAIPDLLQLQLASSKLAFGNHTGQLDMDQIRECLDWAKRFRDEEPHFACEIILRIASSSTNFFEFGIMENTIKEWLDKPIAVAGLRNYGKLQSTLGQIFAFQGKNKESLTCFDMAIETFSCLSDAVEAEQEIRQTRHYRFISEIQIALAQNQVLTYARTETDLLSALVDYFTECQPINVSKAISKGTHYNRYDEHLWLRALISFPNDLGDARQEYVANQSNWGTGTDHPWGLVLAYRAWLLHDFGEKKLAGEVLKEAIASCKTDGHGPALDWIAEVIRTFGEAIDIKLESESTHHEQRQFLMQRIRLAPHEALKKFAVEVCSQTLNRERILMHLEACLPFNFH